MGGKAAPPFPCNTMMVKKMKHLQPYELFAAKMAQEQSAHLSPAEIATSRADFLEYRRSKMASIETGIAEWNGAVASAVERVGMQKGLMTKTMGQDWHTRVAQALTKMETPMHSDVILGVDEPFLTNRMLEGRVRVFGATTMSESPEFMPATDTKWPMFPFYTVEPGTSRALAEAGLALLANPPGIEDDEANAVGTPIASSTYARSPMVSIEVRVNELPSATSGALLLNWSFRGRQGAMAKVFIDGLLDVPAFGIASTDEDRTPNFWTVLPMRPGATIIDLKHVGAGFLWFEHCDVHSVTWNE